MLSARPPRRQGETSFAALLLSLGIVSGFAPAARAQSWLDPAWAHRRSVTVNNATVAPLTNYPVRIDLDASFDFDHAQPNGEDVRVTVDGTTLIPHWIERWEHDEDGDSLAVIWAK